MESFIKRFEQAVQRHWHQPAVSNYRQEPLLYADLATEIEQLHLLWRKAGLVQGDKITIHAASSEAWIRLFMAVVSGGYIAVPLLSGYTPHDTQQLIAHSESRLLYTEESLFAKMDFEAMPDLLAAIDTRTGLLLAARGDFERHYQARKEAFAQHHPTPLHPEAIHYAERGMEQVCVINYTSGSTGNPKGVMLTIGNFSTNVESIIDIFPFQPGERYLSILPLAHIFGLTVDGITPLCTGMHLTILAALPTPTTLKAALCEIRPRLFFAVPLVLSKMIDYTIGEFVQSKSGREKLADYRNHPDFCAALRTIFMAAFGDRCEYILTGGAAIPAHIEELLHQKLQVPFMTGYGMTECAPVISIGLKEGYKLRSSGQILSHYQYRIDSSDPERLAGELQVKGPSLFVGYYKNPEATAEAFTGDGYFRTGDLGIADRQRHLFLVGRCKSMLLSTNGQNIFPEEIEVILNTFPYVAESLIVQRNNRLAALIVPHTDQVTADRLDAASLHEMMRRNLEELNHRIPAYSAVTDFELLNEPFAKTPKGSIKRFLYA